MESTCILESEKIPSPSLKGLEEETSKDNEPILEMHQVVFGHTNP